MEHGWSLPSLAILSLSLCLSSIQAQDYSSVDDYFTSWESNALSDKLYPFGLEFYDERDTGQTSRTKDTAINFAIPFYGRDYSSAFVNLNGHVSLGEESHYKRGTPLPNQDYGQEGEKDYPMVAVYYAEHDPKPATYFYWRTIDPSDYLESSLERQITDRMLEEFRDDIRQKIMGAWDFEPKYAIVATWHNVETILAACGSDCPVNTYQVAIVTDEKRTFTIMRYAELAWENSIVEQCDMNMGTSAGSSNCFSAQVGFNAGMGRHFTPLPHSNTADVLQLVNVADGFFVYDVTSSQIRHGNCLQQNQLGSNWDLEMFPMDAHMLGGQEIHFSQQCLNSGENIRCRFGSNEVENEVTGEYVDEMRGSCMVPALYRTGEVPVYVYMPGSSTPVVKHLHVEMPKRSRFRVDLSNDMGDWSDKIPSQPLKLRWDPNLLAPIMYEVDNSATSYQAQNVEIDVQIHGYREKNGQPETQLLKKIGERVQNIGEYTFDPVDHTCDLDDCDWHVGTIQVRVSSTQSDEITRAENNQDGVNGGGALRDSTTARPVTATATTTAELTNMTLTDNYTDAVTGEPTETPAVDQPVRITDNRETTVTFGSGIWSPPFHLGWYINEKKTSEMGEDWSDQMCMSWQEENTDHAWQDELTPCPCLYNQGLVDSGRYIIGNVCEENEPCLLKCIISAYPSPSGGASKCCYGAENNNMHDHLLYAGDTGGQSFSERYHEEGVYPYMGSGKIPWFSHFLNDQMGHLWCCEWSADPNNCLYRYGVERPTPDCKNYEQPGIGVAYGDPHFRTFDGKDYTFNPEGEFWLLLMDSVDDQTFSMQVRMQRVSLEEDVEYMGTMITAVVIQASDSEGNTGPLVEVRLNVNEPINRLSVYIDGQIREYPVEMPMTRQFIGSNEEMMVKVMKANTDASISNFTMLFENGIGVSVAESVMQGLHIITILPPKYKGMTKGLLGVWNDDMSDDLTADNGDVIDSTDNAVIHNSFGMSWLVSSDASLFTYYASMTYEYFSNPDFVPNYEPSLQISSAITESEVNSVCGNNYVCRFDYMTMESRDIAEASKSMQMYSMEMEELGAIVPSCGRIDVPWSQRLVDHYMVGGSVQIQGCVEDYELEGNGEYFTCEEHDGVADWSPQPAVVCHASGGGSNAAIIAVPVIIILLIILILVALFMIYKRRKAEQESGTNGHVKKTPEDPGTQQPPRNVSTHPDPYANINEGLSQSTSSVGSVVLTEEIKAARPARPKKVKHNLKPDQNGTQHYDNRAANLDEPNNPAANSTPGYQPSYHPQYDPNPRYDQTPKQEYYANTPQYASVPPPSGRTPEPFPETQKGYDNPVVSGDAPAMDESAAYTTPQRHPAPGGRYTSSVDTTV